jgi:hypothetical protein
MSTCASCGAELSQQWKFCLTCGAPLGDIPAAIRPAGAAPLPRVNLLAIVALVLGIIGGPVAAIFGHVAMKQIAETGERGMLLARIATVLGYVWLAVWVAIIAWVVVVGVG